VEEFMPVIDCAKIEGIKIPKPYERTIKVLLAPDTQSLVKDLSITMGIIAPKSCNDLHKHEGIEILYIASGFGRAVLGDETTEIKQDSLIVAPPGVMHQQINDSDDTMKMVAVWTPPQSGKEVMDRAIKAAKGK
jgi:quercetin dioxygenase-like cupin family protein